MNNQNLLIYESKILYDILAELADNFNFKIIYLPKKKFENINLAEYEDYLILSLDEKLNTSNQISLIQFPIKFSKLFEKINLHFLKQKFNKQSKILIGSYIININSREISSGGVKLKLTEKEINTIIYLKEKNKPVGINELQEQVWEYQFKLETHTVETHIHRLRKKIKEKFKDDNLIISTTNGYKIN